MACSTRYSKSPQFDTIPSPAPGRTILFFLPVIRRLHSTYRLVTFVVLALLQLLWVAPSAAAEDIQIVEAHLEVSEDGYRLAGSYALELNRELEDVILRGIPLHFTTDVQITRPRRYWFDENTATTSQTIRISYNVLTREFRASVGNSLYRSFQTLEDALSLVRRPGRWVVAEKSVLKPGETYVVAVRMGLDVTQLSKPFRVNALNNSDWQVSSEWKQFTYKAEAP
jgi:Domain of unknown function (DUF4390)